MKRRESGIEKEIILRGSTYWYRGTPLGSKSRIELSLHVQEGAPKRLVQMAKKDLLESLGYVGAGNAMTFEALAPKYVAHKKTEQPAYKTIYEVENMIRQLMPFFRKYRIQEINQPIFSEYCVTKKGLSLVPHRKILNQFLKWCVQHSHTKYIMAVEIPKFARKAKAQREVMERQEVLQLLGHMSDRALLYFCMYALMGIRNKESILLQWKNIDLDKAALRIVPESNKNRRGRVIPINSHVMQLLKGLDRHGSEWVFPSHPGTKHPHMDYSKPFRKQWDQAIKKINSDRHFTPHGLRAFFETEMHSNLAFTDTQREKMAGAHIDVQKRDYVTMSVEHLRGIEESVQIEGLSELIRNKTGANAGAKNNNAKGLK